MMYTTHNFIYSYSLFQLDVEMSVYCTVINHFLYKLLKTDQTLDQKLIWQYSSCIKCTTEDCHMMDLISAIFFDKKNFLKNIYIYICSIESETKKIFNLGFCVGEYKHIPQTMKMQRSLERNGKQKNYIFMYILHITYKYMLNYSCGQKQS